METTVTVDKKAIEEKIVNIVAENVIESFEERSSILHDRIIGIVENTVVEHCDKVVQSVIEKGVAEWIIQQTNKYGEKKGGPVTFTEYIVGVASAYLNEKVDYQGKRSERDPFSKKAQSRLTYLLSEHLQYKIQTAMKDAVKIVMAEIAPALATTCELKVKEATEQIRKAMGR